MTFKQKMVFLIALVLVAFVIIGYFIPTPIQVTRVNTNTNHQVSSDELTRVKTLFQQNSIKMDSLAVTEIRKDERDEIHVWAEQFYKGLPIFWGRIGYHFNASGKAWDRFAIDGTREIFTSGKRIDEINLSTEPRISMYQAAMKAREKMKVNYFFSAELGFTDRNAGISSEEPNFAPVWRIKPRGAKYPYADIDANTGDILAYDNGIRY